MTSPDTKILVSGANGFIGRALVKELMRTDSDVVQLDYQQNILDNVPSIVTDLSAENVSIDLDGPLDVVYHFAGKIWGDVETELKILENIISLCLAKNVKKIVYASTCAVYGQEAMDGPVGENVTPMPFSPYAFGKLKGEERLKELAEQADIDVVVLRYFNPYGPGQFEKMAVPSMLAKAQSGQKIEIFGDGEQIRDFIYIQDLITATIEATSIAKGFEIFNIGSGSGSSVNELAEAIIKVSGSKSQIEHSAIPLERQNLEVHYRVADIDKIKSRCQWRPKTSLIDGLKQMVQAQ